MFRETFDQHVIRAAKPFIVVKGEEVSGSFSTLEEAEEFIARQGAHSAFVLKHDGREWVLAADLGAERFSHVSLSLMGREAGTEAGGIAEASVISRIQTTLQAHPRITYMADAHYLEVPAETPTGFKVWIRQRAGRHILGFQAWHEEFRNATPAIEAFLFGLTSACRLRVLSSGGRDYKWQVQRRLGAQWVTLSESGMVLFPFWCKRTERFLQNDLIRFT